MSEQVKDTMIMFRSTIVGKNSKGADRFQLYLTSEQAASLANSITEQLGNELGVKLDVHISDRVQEATGRKFKSTIAFVKPVQEQGALGGQASEAAPKKFKAKAPTTLGQPKVAQG